MQDGMTVHDFVNGYLGFSWKEGGIVIIDIESFEFEFCRAICGIIGDGECESRYKNSIVLYCAHSEQIMLIFV